MLNWNLTIRKVTGKKKKDDEEQTIVYAQLDMDDLNTKKKDQKKSVDELRQEEQDKQDEASDMYATPKKVKESGNTPNPKLMTKQKKAELRKKPSLAAIAIEDGGASAEESIGSGQPSKGGCCVIS